MKKQTKIVLLGIIAVIILIGIILTFTIGFRFDLNYSKNKQVFIPITKDFETSDIKQIVKEVINSNDVIVEKVNEYKDYISIKLNDITDEQKEQINTKINEKYGLENTIDVVTIMENANVKLSDLIKPYISPCIVSFILIIIYVLCYLVYKSKSNSKVNIMTDIVELVLTIILTQGVFFSLIVICRIPFNRVIIPISLVLYVVSTVFYMLRLESKYKLESK